MNLPFVIFFYLLPDLKYEILRFAQNDKYLES